MKQIIPTLLIMLLFTATIQADMKEGDPLPNPTFEAMDGKKVSLHDLMKKVMVLHFWKAN